MYCIHVPGHDPITFSFRSFSFLIGWGFMAQLSKVLKVVCWAGSIPFPQCPCRGRLFVYCCGRCSFSGEPVSSYSSMACCSVVSY